MLALVLACSTGVVSALDPDRPLVEFDLASWGLDDGLPHGYILDAIESPDGYLWAATWRGAVRFNGNRFTVFDQQAFPWVGDGSAYRLDVGRDGSFLIASQRYGISRQQNGRWSQHPWANPQNFTALYSFAEDRAGRLWAGTNEGLIRWDGQAARRFGPADGMPDTGIHRIGVAPDDSVWIGCSTGVVHIVDDRIQVYGEEHGLPAGEVSTILAQDDGTVRVGTKAGAYLLEHGKFRRDPEELPRDQVTRIFRDRRGALWIGTAENGLYRFTPGGVEQLSQRNGLPNNHVSTLAEDSQGNLWIGTFAGLAMLSPARYHEYSRIDGLADDNVRAVAAHADGSIWVATNGGTSRIVDNRIESLAARDPRGAHAALSLLMRRNGEVWIGTNSRGVTIVDGATVRSFGRGEGLGSDEVRAMLEARDGSIWLGSPGAITRLREGQAPRQWLTVGESKQTPFVRALLQDRSGRVWFGLQPGLAWIEHDEVRVLEETVRSGNGIFSLHECEHGAIWAPGQGGLRRWRNGELKQLDPRHGLADVTLFSMLPDGNGTDWFTSSGGLYGIDHAQLEAAMDGATAPLTIKREGDPSSRKRLGSNGGSMPSAMVARDGRLWLATQSGLAVFDPHRADVAPAAPPTVIESIEVDGIVHESSPVLQVAPGARRIEFQYAGLSYSASGTLDYRFRLDGYDDGWIAAEGSTTSSYTNLPPGDYRFHVEALLEGAAGAPQRASQSLRLLPQWHQTAAFRLGLAVLALILLMLGYRWRTGQLRRHAAELQGLVNERTHDLQRRSHSLEDANREKAVLIERLRAQSQILERRSQEDGLTALSNRRHLDASLLAAIDHCRQRQVPIAVALIDIDHFKQVNDRYGHATGDQVLRRVAAAIRERVASDQIAGRYGGEEFAVVFPGATVAEAAGWCEPLREAVANTAFDDLAPGLIITVSIGVGDVDDAEATSPCDVADRRLYLAKHAGRNRVVSTDEPSVSTRAT